MSSHSFNGILSPDVFDHGAAEFYRQQDEARRVRDRITRTELGLIVRLADETFATLDEMHRHVTESAVALGHKIDDETAHVIREAVANLWSTGRYHAHADTTRAA